MTKRQSDFPTSKCDKTSKKLKELKELKEEPKEDEGYYLVVQDPDYEHTRTWLVQLPFKNKKLTRLLQHVVSDGIILSADIASVIESTLKAGDFGDEHLPESATRDMQRYLLQQYLTSCTLFSKFSWIADRFLLSCNSKDFAFPPMAVVRNVTIQTRLKSTMNVSWISECYLDL